MKLELECVKIRIMNHTDHGIYFYRCWYIEANYIYAELAAQMEFQQNDRPSFFYLTYIYTSEGSKLVQYPLITPFHIGVHSKLREDFKIIQKYTYIN